MIDSDNIEFTFSDQAHATFDPRLGAMWLRWNPKPRPCFNPALLAACRECYTFLEQSRGVIEREGEQHRIHASILCSDVPGVFMLGGDLDLFTRLIESHDRKGLMQYGAACVEMIQRNFAGYGLPITTISLVQGECFGGGFEAALSSDFVVAERRARFGFPEIQFNLFPGMGAVSFVARRASLQIADEVTGSGKIYSAAEMLEKGIIDTVVEDGSGPAAVSEYLQNKARMMRSIFAMRKQVWRLKREELDDIVTVWVDAALRLNSRDLRLMKAIVAQQNRLG